ncbi:MAG: hypothetical protein GX650_06835, partial [Clostridiales bacterium]|nr:hypothetical protein [Clostridiales bacterium]
MRETCVIVDGHSLMHRAFHALPLMDADGVYTNAVHGFLSMLLRVFREQQPQYCAVAFDDPAPTFRHERYPEYKAGRKSMDEELRGQFPLIKELLTAMGIGVVTLPGYEADDLLGSIARQANQKDIHALLVTGDKDALQLVNDGTTMLMTRRGISDVLTLTPPVVKEQYGVTPEQVPDWKGLMGDSSDNIPGVPGVGEKTAVKLLAEYGTLDEVLTHAGEVKGKLGERLRENMDKARFSRELATINREAPYQASFGEWTLDHLADGLPLLRQYQLNTVAAELTRMTARQQSRVGSQEEDRPLQELDSVSVLQAFLEVAKPGELCVLLAEDALTLYRGDGQAARLALASGQQDLFSTQSAPTDEEALCALSPDLMRCGLITHGAKRFLHRLQAQKLPIPEVKEDTLILSYLHNPQEKSYALSSFALPDARGVHLLLQKRLAQVQEDGMETLYRQIELPLVRVLFDMEVAGFQVDRAPLEEMGQRFTAQTAQLQEEIYTL